MGKIYIGNLPFRTNEQEIEEAFAKFGEIEDVFLLRHRDSGRLKGFGFVTFTEKSAADDAIKEMDGQDFGGRPLKVSIAQAKEKSEGGGFSGGRGGDRGGDRGGRY